LDPIAGHPLSLPKIYNVTYIGQGNEATGALMSFNNNAGGSYRNSIFVHHALPVLVEYKEDRENSYTQFQDQKWDLTSNIFFQIAGDDYNEIVTLDAEQGVNTVPLEIVLKDSLVQWNNLITDPGISVNGRIIDPVPAILNRENLAPYQPPYGNSWFMQVDHRGAFQTTDWTANWTLFSQVAYFRK
jgi:hypothetical protein